MTTIAYRDGILASDSRLTEKHFIWTDECQKIVRLKDGSLFGSSGEGDAFFIIRDALNAGRTIPNAELLDCKAIHIRLNGDIYTYEGLLWTPWPHPFVTIGSGKKYARAAMLAGASAEEAIRVAIQCDVHSGGAVQTLRLGDK